MRIMFQTRHFRGLGCYVPAFAEHSAQHAPGRTLRAHGSPHGAFERERRGQGRERRGILSAATRWSPWIGCSQALRTRSVSRDGKRGLGAQRRPRSGVQPPPRLRCTSLAFASTTTWAGLPISPRCRSGCSTASKSTAATRRSRPIGSALAEPSSSSRFDREGRPPRSGRSPAAGAAARCTGTPRSRTNTAVCSSARGCRRPTTTIASRMTTALHGGRRPAARGFQPDVTLVDSVGGHTRAGPRVEVWRIVSSAPGRPRVARADSACSPSPRAPSRRVGQAEPARPSRAATVSWSRARNSTTPAN